MYYILWIISAFIAVGTGVYLTTRLDKQEASNPLDNK